MKKIILDTVADLARKAPTEEEVERAKTRIVQGMDRSFANSQQLAMQLTDVIADGDWRLLFTNYEELKRVTAEDVTQVAKTYFKDSNRTVGTFIPETAPDRTTVPDAPAIETLLSLYTPDIKVETGEALDPSPAAIEKRIKRSTLPGGLRLALLAKETRGNRVQASLTLRFGDENSLAGQQAVAQMTDALLIARHQKQIAAADSRRDAEAQRDHQYRRRRARHRQRVNISTTAENLIPALRLAVEILREPAFPESDFDQIRKQRIAAIDRGRTEPGTLVSQTLQSHVSPYPRTRCTPRPHHR